MLQVSGFGVRNLRALRDTGWIQIRPINILVGKNSAGKSSLARVFPLLKQSAERRKQAPLLWYGRLVDFGSFADAVSSFADPAEIELKLRFDSYPLYVSRRTFIVRTSPSPTELCGQIDATLTLAEGSDGRTQLRQLTLNVFGVEVVASFSTQQGADTLRVAGSQPALPTDTRLVWLQGVILPQLRLLVSDNLTKHVSDADFAAPRRRLRLGEHEVERAVSHFVHGNTLRERKLEIADRLPLAQLDALYEACSGLSSVPDTWRANIAATPKSSYWMKELHQALVLYKLDALLVELDEALSAFCNGISYLEPLRATAQRYYRREEVSVDELDPKGLNTAFFVQGLSVRERDSLNAWLESTFGFQLIVKPERGHLALQIQVDGGAGVGRNMADVGLGYSQLAPVAIQLWAAQQSKRSITAVNRARPSSIDERRNSPGTLVVVEQPELHLHPAFQSKLADVFAACVSEGGSPASTTARPALLRLIAETHSANLVGRLGELVGAGKIPAESINVLVFEPDSDNFGATKIRIAEFDNDGVLQNWPIGFFDS
jgi:hypothetical protein